jgi:hypothetical protein
MPRRDVGLASGNELRLGDARKGHGGAPLVKAERLQGCWTGMSFLEGCADDPRSRADRSAPVSAVR